MHILTALPVDLALKRFLVVGQGASVGKPVTHLLRQQKFLVRTANRSTLDMTRLLKSADVIISGTGQPSSIKGSSLKPGVIVIDAGTSEDKGGIVGDVDFESVAKVASFVSPVPGGVGPVTVAKLLENVVTVAERSLGGWIQPSNAKPV